MRQPNVWLRATLARGELQLVQRAFNGVRSTAEQLLAPRSAGPDHDAPLRERLAAALLERRPEILQAWWTSQFDPARLRRFAIAVEDLPPRRAIARAFLIPLFELLRAWVRTGERRYADVYLDERLRYAPHQAAWVLRTQFFDEVLALDERALADALPDDALRSALRALVRELHAPLRAPAPATPLRLLAMGDCLMNEVRVALLSRCRAQGLPLDFRGQYFSALYGSGLSAEPALALLREFPADLIALSFLSYRGIVPYAALLREARSLRAREVDARVDGILAVVREFVALLRSRTTAPLLLHNASGLPLEPWRRVVPFAPPMTRLHREIVAALNARLAELAANVPNAILVDEARVARAHGYRACMERVVPPTVASGGEFHTARFGEYLVPEYLDVLASYRQLARCKVLAVDFDETLWDGVMAEGAVRQRHDLQRQLRRLKEAGILLVATSKNDPKNIRWSEMLLQPSDFVLQKVSWSPKAQSIQEAAQELGLGIDAFVLLDDSALERDLVQARLPQVRVLDPNAPHARRWLGRMLSFPNTGSTEEARQRTELYRQQTARATVVAARADDPGVLATLGLRACFGEARERELDRVVELVQRTNQFNTTTIRYTRQQLVDMLRGDAHGVYTATLADRFGSIGLVAVAIVRRDGAARRIEAFVMSCRAMGLGLEQLVLRRVLDAEGGPLVRFIGRYVPTERNGPCSGLFESAGFSRAGDTEWVLEPDAPRPAEPTWFQVTAPGQRAA